jgi:hypothetical protein
MAKRKIIKNNSSSSSSSTKYTTVGWDDGRKSTFGIIGLQCYEALYNYPIKSILFIG